VKKLKKAKKVLGKVVPASSKWTLDRYLTVYNLSKQGATFSQIAESLGMSIQQFTNRKAADPELKRACDRAVADRRQAKEAVETFQDYVYGRLPDHLKVVWDRIQEVDDNHGLFRQVQIMVEEKGKRSKQHLFLYALVHHNFSMTPALQCLGLKRKEVDEWILTDPDFGDLFSEIQLAKKDFFEAALVALVKEGNTAAVIFANKMINSDRGYNKSRSVKVEMEGKVTHSHTAVSIESLGLSVEERKKILEAYQRQRGDFDPDGSETGSTTSRVRVLPARKE
jgi:hypothetical protein